MFDLFVFMQQKQKSTEHEAMHVRLQYCVVSVFYFYDIIIIPYADELS